MKQIITCICLMLTTVLVAQTSMTNTTTITVDRNIDGKIQQEVIVIEGDGAEKKLKQLEKDDTVVNINVEKRVEMLSDDPNSEAIKANRKKMDQELTNIEQITGKKADRKEENVEIEVTADDHQQIKRYKVKVIENGKEEVMEWNGEGEMPEKMNRIIGDTKVNMDVRKQGMNNARLNNMAATNPKAQQIYKDDGEVITSDDVVHVSFDSNTNKAQLGVMIGSNDEGVKVFGFSDNDSPAKAAGLQIGDIITSINGEQAKSADSLIQRLSSFAPGDIVNVNYIREGKSESKKITLGKN